MFEPFAQRAVFEVLLLSVGAGVLGPWIVMRGLAFYSHAVAVAAFPGLVLAAGLGFAPLGGALGAGALMALGLSARPTDVVTALALVGALAGGVVLASDVFHSGSQVDTLLFGSLFAVSGEDLRLAGAASAAAALVTFAFGPRWLAAGFDAREPHSDAVLIALVGLIAVASLAAVGALLATALLVVPAASARLWVSRIGAWQLATVALAAAEGVGGVWLAVRLNAPPGATIATLGGVVFAFAVLIKRD